MELVPLQRRFHEPCSRRRETEVSGGVDVDVDEEATFFC